MAGSEDEWKLLYMVRGYHVYKYVGSITKALQPKRVAVHMHDKEKKQCLLLCSTHQLVRPEYPNKGCFNWVYFLQHVLCPEEHYECALAVKLLQPWGVKKMSRLAHCIQIGPILLAWES